MVRTPNQMRKEGLDVDNDPQVTENDRLGQLPSTQLDHYFEKGPHLVLTWRFDPSRYGKDQPPAVDGTPAWQGNAEADKQVLKTLYDQLVQKDAEGRAITVMETVTSLVAEPGNQVQAISASEATALVEYVFAAWQYVVKVLAEGGNLPPDSDLPKPVTITREIQAEGLGVMTEIKVAFQLRRRDSADASFVAATVIPPRLVEAEGRSTLAWYATQCQEAFDGPDFQLRLAVGNGEQSDTLWAVRFGKSGSQPYQYHLTSPAIFFARAPLSTTLTSHPGVTLYSYTPEDGLSVAPDVTHSFTGVYLEDWGRSALSAIDQLLSLKYAVPAFAVDKVGSTDYLEWMSAQKSRLADALVLAVTNILAQPALEPTKDKAKFEAARAQLRQELLLELGSAFTVDAIIQHEVAVDGPQSQTVPTLVGNPVIAGDSKDFSASPFKVRLQNGTSLLSYAIRTGDAGGQTNFPLRLSYQPTQISTEPGTPGGHATFVQTLPPIELRADQKPPVTAIDLTIPIPLVAYPRPPQPVSQIYLQEATSQDAPTMLQKAKEWTFRFTYVRANAAQDRIDVVVRFNVTSEGGFLTPHAETVDDLVVRLARINHVLGQIQAVFDQDLLQVELDTDPASPTFQRAQKALAAFTQLIDGLDQAWENWIEGHDEGTKLPLSILDQELPFSITEDCLTKPVTAPGASADLAVLRITIAYPTALLPGMQLPPSATFEGYLAEEVDPSPRVVGDDQTTRKSWMYKKVDPNGDEAPYLTWQQAQAMPERRIDLAGLSAFQFENALANLRTIRNSDLVSDDNPTREPFVYRTPAEQFSDKLAPLLDTNKEIDIAQVPTGRTEQRTMAEHVAGLLCGFFGGSRLNQQTIQLEVRYAYALFDQVESPVVELPILDTKFPIPEDGVVGSELVAELAEGIRTWFQRATPSRRQGHFKFSLTAFASDPGNTQPLVRLRGPVLAVADVTDLGG